MNPRRFGPLLALLTLAIFSSPAQTTFDPAFLESHTVRVLAYAEGNNRAASGFLWQSSNNAITALHAVVGAKRIVVQCAGISIPARISKVLPQADLALLSLDQAFNKCKPFINVTTNAPKPYSDLWTFGFHAGTKSGSSRGFKKGYASKETLEGLISGVPLQQLRKLGMPSTKLDVYYVEGGLLPGYSGGPVVDANRQLIGIVDGGLDRGQSDYNWVIPGKYISQLIMADQSNLVALEQPPSDNLFSSGIVENQPNNTIRYVDGANNFEWVLTKTRSLRELTRTADDPDTVLQLVKQYAGATGSSAEELLDQLRYNIYKETSRGLLIAVPEGRVLRPETLSGGRFTNLQSLEKSPLGDNYLIIAHDERPWVRSPVPAGGVIYADDPRYVNESTQQVIADCGRPDANGYSCRLLPGSFRITDFGGGKQTVSLGEAISFRNTGKIGQILYRAYAINGAGRIFLNVRINSFGSGVGLIQCMFDRSERACSSGDASRQQLSLLIAAHLTSFLGSAQSNEAKLVSSKFDYDTSYDNPTTAQFTYYEDDKLIFHNYRGALWRKYSYTPSGKLTGSSTAIEIRRKRGMVYLKQIPSRSGDFLWHYAVPANGGVYKESRYGDKGYRKRGKLTKVSARLEY